MSIISTNQTSTVLANTSNETFALLEGVRLVPTTGSAISAAAGTGRHFVIDGDIFGNTADAISITGASSNSINSIIIGETGTVHGGTGTAISGAVGFLNVFNDGLIEGLAGVASSGDETRIANSGIIRSTLVAAVTATGGLTLENTGEIVAHNANAVELGTSDYRLFNSGLISGESTDFATISLVSGGGAFSVFENTGTINSTGIAFQSGGGQEEFFNSGIVVGSMDFSSGTDFYDGSGGRLNGDLEMGDGEDFITLRNGAYISGSITGGGGDDEYVIDRDDYQLSEQEFGGVDTVRSSVSHALGDNFEFLVLTGTGDLAGRGNGTGNTLTGNDGDNSLFGRDGNDVLNGGDGGDLLNGGGNIDIASYSSSSIGVTINLATGKAFGGDADGDRLISIEGVSGSNFSDRLTGSKGDNSLAGEAGNDFLAGGKGADQLFGGTGVDTFIFSTRDGQDFIFDYATSDGEKIDLSRLDAVTSFADLKAHHMEQDGIDVVITAGKDVLTLFDTDIADLGKSDFIF